MKYRTYENPKYGFKIDYHPHWNIIERPNILMAFLSPLVGSEDQFRENLVISREALPNINMSLEQYMEMSINQLEKEFKNFRLIESGSAASLARGKALKLIYNATSGKFYLKIMQIFTLKDGYAYILTYTAENNHYEEFINEIKKMIKSFRPLNP